MSVSRVTLGFQPTPVVQVPDAAESAWTNDGLALFIGAWILVVLALVLLVLAVLGEDSEDKP